MARRNALNQDFKRFDQVEKSHAYRLAEQDGDEFDDDYRIATLDLGQFLHGDARQKAGFAEEFTTALKDIGFAVLVGHGVDPALYDEMHDGVVDLFTHTSLADKMRFRAARHGSISQGFPIEETSEIHPDLVEGWVWCRRAFAITQADGAPADTAAFWPRPQDEPRFRKLAEAHEPLFKPIMQAILQGLGCDPHAYDAKLTTTNFGMRLNYYPPMSADQDESGAGRLLGHEDVDLFTILPATRVDGLQVWNHRSGKWVRLHASAGSIIINSGDYLQRITNDVIPSTTHRVGKPADGSHRGQPRVSFPIAVYVWEDEVLEVLPGLGIPKYPPIKAIQFHTRSTSKFYGEEYAVD